MVSRSLFSKKESLPLSDRDGGTYRTDCRTDSLWTLAIAAATLLVLLSLRPFSDMPRNDDFSYARTALAFAQTGRLVYNGWGSPTMIPQAIVGGILIRLFGFSYSLLDGISVVCAAGAASVLFLMGRLCRLSRASALLATIAFVGTPMFLGCAASFMTDIPSVLLMLLALWALLHSFGRSNGDSTRTLSPPWFAGFVVLSLLAGSNRQSSWVACIAAAVPVFFAIRSRRDQLWCGGGIVLLLLAAIGVIQWWNAQPFIAPTDTGQGLLILIGYPEVALPVLYKILVIFGIFALPFAVTAVRGRDLTRPVFWVALILGAGPLFYPVSQKLSCFNPFLGVAEAGQYFTSRGTPSIYLQGAKTMETSVFPPLLVDALMVAGAVALGLTLFCLLDAAQSRKHENCEVDTGSPYLRTMRWALGWASLSQIIVSIPWLAGMHGTDRYFICWLPPLALFLLARTEEKLTSRPLRLWHNSALFAVATIGVMAAVAYAFAATSVHCSAAQAAVYHRLRKMGVPPEQIDNGFELDGDAQIAISGHVNYRLMLPKSAFDPNAKGRNLTSPIAEVFPAMDAHYILSLDPAPTLPFAIDPKPVDRETFDRLIPPWHLTVYAFRVLPDGGTPSDSTAPSPVTP